MTKRLCQFIATITYADLSREVVQRAKDCLLDWIGCAIAGKGSPTDLATASLIREMGGRGCASLVGFGAGAAPLQAALYNGMISAVAESDDVHEDVSLHPGIGVIPAALAVGEYASSSGKALLVGIVTGYDVAVRVARAAGISHYHFWHSTGTCTTFGAAAAAGKLLRLDPERLCMTQGLAGTQAAGLWESINTTAVSAKHLHSGKAASNGVLSAFLARNGLRGSPTILEGAKGFLASASKAVPEDLARLTENLGAPFLIMRNFFKRYASCKACIDGIEGLLALMARHRLRPSDITQVTVTLRPENLWLVGNPNPQDAYEAKFSLPFCLALAALTGRVGPQQFTDRALRHRRVREWMAKVAVRGDPELVSRARVQVDTAGGRAFSTEPFIRSCTSSEVREKFGEVVRPALGARRADAILECVESLEKVQDIRVLGRLLRRRITCPV